MFDIGRVVIKLSGKEAGKVALIVDVLDKKTVMIDGNLKRRKCNVNHLEPLSQTIDIKKGASTEEVKKALEAHNLLETKPESVANRRERKKGAKPVKMHKKKEVPTPAEKSKKAPKAKKAPKISEDEAVEAALAKV